MILDMEELDDNTNDESWFLASDFEKIEETMKKISTGILFMVAGFCVGGCYVLNSDTETSSDDVAIVGDREFSCIKNIALFLFSVSMAAVMYEFSGVNFSINTDALEALDFYHSHPFTGAFRASGVINRSADSDDSDASSQGSQVVEHDFD